VSQPSDDIKAVFSEVATVLAATRSDHAFIGALPVLAWGRVRATADIDVSPMSRSKS
jgi:hypothetical protein